MGQPASNGTDIPTRWASEITPSSTPLPEYPRPQMVRGTTASVLGKADKEYADAVRTLRDHGGQSWTNLNGLWEWEPTTDDSNPPFGRTLNSSIMVPFPVESCLSGVAPQSSDAIVMHMWYRLTFDAQSLISNSADDGLVLLHFGAVDWNSSVYLNGKLLGAHSGGYDGFSFTLSATDLKPSGNELLVYVFDPSDTGKQPNGKQRISAISRPGGDTYTPSSGIWQTVWLEPVPKGFIESLNIDQASLTAVTVTANTGGDSDAISVSFTVKDSTGKTVATASGSSGVATSITIPNPSLWDCDHPNLYDLEVQAGSDAVTAYFGLRTYELGDGPKGKRPLLNGKFAFAAGFLDQSWFPDGLYTAPTDEALAYDVTVLPSFGLNMIRLHQKVNPERWYYHADRTGILIFQDVPQKYGGATEETIPFYLHDLRAMIAGRFNHPCIVQIETFNEGDCYAVFKNPPNDVPSIVALAKKLAPTRLVDTDSGGGANRLYIGDVNDIHSYPWPGNPMPSSTQYAMVGEFGGIGAFQSGHMWTPNGCHTYLRADTAHDEANLYNQMAAKIEANADHISASVYTQTTDVENECDGFLNMDRTNKFSDEDTKAIQAANLKLRATAERLQAGPEATQQ